MRKQKCLVTKHFLKNHAKTIKISCPKTTRPLSRRIFALPPNISVLSQDRTCSKDFIFLITQQISTCPSFSGITEKILKPKEMGNEQLEAERFGN